MIAIDIAILPPPDISRRAIELSATLPRHESVGLRLSGDDMPSRRTSPSRSSSFDGDRVKRCVEIDTVLDGVESALAAFFNRMRRRSV